MSSCSKFLQLLRGEWDGAGTMMFPTITNKVAFDSKRTFAQPEEKTKVPFFFTSQSSWKSGTNRSMGMHYDTGFLKCLPDGSLEWIMAHNSSNAEVMRGEVAAEGHKAVFSSLSVPNAVETKATRREVTVSKDGSKLSEKFYMATESVAEMTLHLDTEYTRSK